MKLLVVDDHPLVRDGIREILDGAADIDVFEAATGDEAVALCRSIAPDIVILDIRLGGLSGLDVLRSLSTESTRVIVFSTYADPSYVIQAVRGGAWGYVTKSADIRELVFAIRHVASGELYLDSTLATTIALAAINRSEAEVMH